MFGKRCRDGHRRHHAWPLRRLHHPHSPGLETWLSPADRPTLESRLGRSRSPAPARTGSRTARRPLGAPAVIAVEVPCETGTGTSAWAAGSPAAARPLGPPTPCLTCRPHPKKVPAPQECSTSFAEPRPSRPLKAGRLPPLLSTPVRPRLEEKRLDSPPSGPAAREGAAVGAGAVVRPTPSHLSRRSGSSRAPAAAAALGRAGVPRRRRRSDPCPSARPGGDATSPRTGTCFRAN